MSYNPDIKKPRIIAVAAMSMNGLITNGSDSNPANWTSEADKVFFADMLARAQVVVMGLTTFLAQNPQEKPRNKNRFSVVLTHRPHDFFDYAVPGVREFWNKSPQEVTVELSQRGYQEILLVGGSKVYGDFIAAGLVDELYLTVEPVIFGQGTPIVGVNIPLHEIFTLDSVKRLNDTGTLLLKYGKNT